jgi:regulator of protease activity HflC (stomatin/prohibitin superfamily)
MSTHDPSATVDAPEMPAPRVREFPARSVGGGLALLCGLVGLLAGAGMIAAATTVTSSGTDIALITGGILVALAAFLAMCGLNMVAPGEDGLRWVNPFTSREKISTRVRNHETAVLKVNDAYGNPIELAAVVVWKVQDTAQASFEVDDFLEFVATQTEAAVRHIAIEYPYDAHEVDGLSLRGNAEEITEKLAAELHARFTHLAYAPEIASAMLQRQQAGAVVAARREIVDGAVGMVEAALGRIAEQGIVELDEERKAAMVSNLMVVLCGDRSPQPVLNTGTLYQ